MTTWASEGRIYNTVDVQRLVDDLAGGVNHGPVAASALGNRGYRSGMGACDHVRRRSMAATADKVGRSRTDHSRIVPHRFGV